MTNFSTTIKIVKSRHRAIVLFYSIFPENWTFNREDLGTRFSCFGSEYKKEMGELLAKNVST